MASISTEFERASVEAELQHLTRDEIIECFRGQVTFSRDDRRTKAALIARVLSDCSEETLAKISGDARTRRSVKDERRIRSSHTRKRKRAESQTKRRKALCTENQRE